MKINQKIELSVEEREEIEKKERRNETITTVIAIASTVAGYLISRRLQKQLNVELDSLMEAKTEEDENN